MSTDSPGANRKTITTGIVGNILEWYDFAIYGYFAPIIGRQFFPSDNETASILAAFGVFAAGYLARPFGGMFFGHISDKAGRKAVLILSVCMMGVSTFLIGVLPGYAEIGVSAAVILIILRVVQGFSVGGEFAGSIIFLAENAPKNRRGFTASWSTVGASSGFLLGSGVGALFTAILSPEVMGDWGWRVPFLIGILIGLVGLYVRRDIEEKELEESEFAEDEISFLDALKSQWRNMFRICGIILMANVGFYLMFVYITSYLTEFIHAPSDKVLEINTVSLIVLTIMGLVGGHLSDKIGRKPVLITLGLGVIFLSYPLMSLLTHNNDLYILIGQVGFAILIGMTYGVNPATLVEIIPANVRGRTISVAYNVCLAAFGGTTPFVAEYLMSRTHDDYTPAYILIVVATISTAVVFSLKETAHKPLQ
ncbi:MAG: MFS transporter [Rhodospirillaceae bacterium]|jgi:MFS transporter, MHS family, proline/betaine transporter|nr:MFS transporter [Rhodospirillaceae bacterium]MBT5660024.1 MFS transporter [Rhodospirillaceae bacterium]MBT5752980.1 MFS transporter [Rhodospirillaceae bacterium]